MISRLPPRILLALIGALACHGIAAQDARVRATLQAEDTIWVGQQMKVVVELLVPGYFDSAASFGLPDPDSVLLMPPSGHPVVSNETIDGALYSVQRHVVSAWPMKSGAQEVPAFSVRFSFKRKPLDKEGEPASVTTMALPFTVESPPGAENLGTVISARNLEVRESWDPEPGTEAVEAGTAFTRTVTFTAPDVPGMIFPPFPAGDIEGLGIYTKRSLRDQQDRGSLTGMRGDEITYLCKRPGQFTIPAAQFTWFDLDSLQLRTEALPQRTLNVVANPALASADPSTDAQSQYDARSWFTIGSSLVMILLLTLAARSHRVRRMLTGAIAPFRPVHLQPLNPGTSHE